MKLFLEDCMSRLNDLSVFSVVKILDSFHGVHVNSNIAQIMLYFQNDFRQMDL